MISAKELLVFLVLCSFTAYTAKGFKSLNCTDFGSRRHNARGTGYFPDNSTMEGGTTDMHGNPLHTLQKYLAGGAPFVSTAMDNTIGIAYGTPLCIPQLNFKYKQLIRFEVVDTGGAFIHKGYSRIDVCTQDREHSWDPTINGPLTLVFQ
ncbi:uncharacterized protein [Littorina saxatilis]|uniref:Uncharacterized protein n=1 Tax=Littorina saxatilis TaxID=31220 RepID=A0AAN9G2E9_9CAEN